MRLIRFGDYVFPAQTELSNNAGNVVTRTTRLPGLSGVYNQLGRGPALSEQGDWRTSFWIEEGSNAAGDGINVPLRERIDRLYGLLGVGVRRLWIDPKDGAAPRYADAIISNISTPENVQAMPHLRLRATLNFQLDYPRWMRDAAAARVWGDGGSWGGGLVWGGTGTSYNVGTGNVVNAWGTGGVLWGGGAIWGEGVTTTITVVNEGNAISLPRLLFTATSPISDGLLIERLAGGVVREALRYTGVIETGQILDLNCRELSARLDGSAAYANVQETHAAWLQLAPGVNTLRVTMATGGGKLRIIYPHTWYT